MEKAESGLSSLNLEQKHNGLIAALLLFYVSPNNATNPNQCDGGSDLSSVQIVNDQFVHLVELIEKSDYSTSFGTLLQNDVGKFVSIQAEKKMCISLKEDLQFTGEKNCAFH